jgi:hypothetical protein
LVWSRTPATTFGNVAKLQQNQEMPLATPRLRNILDKTEDCGPSGGKRPDQTDGIREWNGMTFKKFSMAIALILLPFAAQALTIKTVATNANAWSAVNTANSVALPNGATWTSAPLKMPNPWFAQIDPCISFCSPFDAGVFGTNQTIDATPLAGWQSIPFWATWQSANRTNANLLSFGKTQSSLSLLWGSLDSGNLIELLLSGVVVGSVAGNGLPGVTVQNPGRGAALIKVVNVAFDGLRFSSTLGGFEFANVETSAIPAPLPLAGLLTALGMMAALRRRTSA